jgi:UDP-N-acetylglucosamine diphosphorylase / glucose-1-phosphate thymidylyltransferase / UDP-N-acetylgalactosamine diphosphorylase / glucosamine-1-phosphate N-acetyltransferase / galactosamine-1-phosphate N-acetyltransferase
MSFDPSDCWPLSLTREIAEFPIANIPLSEHSRRVGVSPTHPLTFHPEAWLEPTDMAAFSASDKSTLVDSQNIPLAWSGTVPDLASTFTAASSFIIHYPWDLLRANELYVSTLTGDSIHGEIHPNAVIDGTLHLGLGTRILPGVFIEGNVVIGDNCKIGPNCYIRGNTSIGDNCHIGQSVEIKNCLILSNTNVGHLSYIGDSVLGEKVNLGAGTTTSNLRHDGKNHRSMVNGVLIDTGRRKFGTIIGDHVHTGINTSIYPGRKLWPNTTTRPGEIVQQDLQSPISNPQSPI